VGLFLWKNGASASLMRAEYVTYKTSDFVMVFAWVEGFLLSVVSSVRKEQFY
jgi:hypothetical protein